MRLILLVLEFLFPSRSTERLVREATIESLGMFMNPLHQSEDTITLLPYRAPLVRSLILEAKFRDNGKAQQLLGFALADYLNAWDEERAALDSTPVTLVPVPLSHVRFAERGYNQSERILATALSMVEGMHNVPNTLVRTRHTLPQTSLDGAARRNNLIGAFAAEGVDPNHTYIVVDDVMTTGSTLSAAIEALRDAGALRVIGLSLAH